MSDTMPVNCPDLPCGWECSSLAEIAQINPPIDRCPISESIQVNFVPMRAVEAEGGGLTHPEARPYGEVKKGYTAFLTGDVIMAKITPCMENGKTAVVPNLPGQVCFGSTEFHVIRVEQGITTSWIARYLLQQDIRRAAQRQMTGGVGQMRVPTSFLENLQIPLAPGNEQIRIADALDELFSDLDEGVAALRRVQEKLRLYRASVLKAAVEGDLTAEWRAQHPDVEPASEFLKRILAERRRRWEEDQLRKFKEKGQEPPKDWKAKYKEPVDPDTSELPPLPEGWCWATLEQITFSLMNGYGKRAQAEGEPCIVLRLADIVEGEISYSNARKINCTKDEISRYALKKSDLLIIRVNGSSDLVGRIALVRDTAKETLFCDHFIRAQTLDPTLAVWLSIYSNCQRFRRFVDFNKVSSAGQNTINQGTLLRFAVPIPLPGEQEAIVEAVENQMSIIDHLKAQVETKLRSAQALRQAILHHAFSGKLVPQDPNDESASELLKRIAAEREARARETAGTKQALKSDQETHAARSRRPRRKKTKDN
jgi:type I restriction enzyme, S subunit